MAPACAPERAPVPGMTLHERPAERFFVSLPSSWDVAPPDTSRPDIALEAFDEDSRWALFVLIAKAEGVTLADALEQSVAIDQEGSEGEVEWGYELIAAGTAGWEVLTTAVEEGEPEFLTVKYLLVYGDRRYDLHWVLPEDRDPDAVDRVGELVNTFGFVA